MKKLSPVDWKNTLLTAIDTIADNKALYFEKPETSFSRIQKISLRDTMLFPMIADHNTTAVELLDYFQADKLPTQAAMSYRRDLLKVEAFKTLFELFSSKIPCKNDFHGLRVIACDGSRINTPYNPKDKDSFVNCIENRRGYNQYHLTTLYDVLNEVFTDAVIQGYHAMNENSAFCSMLDRSAIDQKSVFVADRGFSSYNVFAHAIKGGHKFLIRLPIIMARSIFSDTQDIDSSDVLDVEDNYYIGRRRCKNSRSLKNYHRIGKRGTYDYLSIDSYKIDSFRVRLVKFPLPGGESEYLLTNLPKDAFSLDDLKELYRIRWGIETSYRYLKYASGMVHIHSLKQKFIFQEIFAKLTLYNFCTAVKQCTKVEVSADVKHTYAIEKTYLIKTCIRFLKDMLSDIIDLVEKRKVPVRADRRFQRNMRRQHADTTQYR